ncbi:type VI secretion system contractile sheath small subunit [Desulfobulbus elongatus]|uniref:type VI secretion system contractile sheath small subunit n=1 Tax=Desulfobulbus elongatus TaxID=53332 RepID=UPI000486C75A|nr:type VI secretion system contractile sheath small subunit [Desulfobulbus elongatus]
MAKEGSVAPKERVNVVYRPAIGDAKQEVELPMKILVMGDFTQKEDGRMVEERASINVDKDNFNEVLKAHDLNLKTTVDNKLSEEADAVMSLDLDFKSLADFEPDSILQKVPELKKLYELREALKAIKGPLGNIPDFKKKLTQLVADEGAREKLLKELGID